MNLLASLSYYYMVRRVFVSDGSFDPRRILARSAENAQRAAKVRQENDQSLLIGFRVQISLFTAPKATMPAIRQL